MKLREAVARLIAKDKDATNDATFPKDYELTDAILARVRATLLTHTDLRTHGWDFALTQELPDDRT